VPAVRRKAFAYVTHRDRLLVFSHPRVPHAGIQVPAGTIEQGETPAVAALREAREETGLDDLRLVRYLGEDLRPMADVSRDVLPGSVYAPDELHHRYFFHVLCAGDPPARWRRHETSGAPAPDAHSPLFELFWAELPGGVPELIADHGKLLPRLLELLGLAEHRPPSPPTARASPDLPARLAHVLWIGGPPDAGKSTAAALLAERHALQLYHFDRWEGRHIARMDPAGQPALDAFCRMSMDERWVLRTPAEMADETVRSWTERFWMAVADLLAMPPEPRIVAEGPGLFPECVHQLISHPRQAIWLLPTPAFKQASAGRRDKPPARHSASDPERAARNWLARDLLLGEHVRARAAALGLPTIEIDGGLSADQVAGLLERHFDLAPA
jgi:8-oxo-dGTP diphosphatase